MSTAGLIIIGNEVLSGKVREENASFVIDSLAKIGVQLQRISVIRDDVDVIAAEVRAMASAYDYVFTSGGVGATHDDVTYEGVARAFDVELVEDLHLVRLLEAHYRERMNPMVRRMATVPSGAVLIGAPRARIPVVRKENVFVLPGVPSLFRNKFEALAADLVGEVRALRELYLSVGEDRIAEILRDVAAAFPTVEIGSYPRFDEADHRVKVTLEGVDGDLVEAAKAELEARFGPDWVVRRSV